MTDALHETPRLIIEDPPTPNAPTAEDPLGAVRTVRSYLPSIQTERSPSDAGGVPIPKEWGLVRAILGGADRATLEEAFGITDQAAEGMGLGGEKLKSARTNARAMLEMYERRGAYLPAGLHVFTGQTGGGKSAFVTNLAFAAATHGHPVLYVSLELDGHEITARLVALSANIPWGDLALSRELTDIVRAARDAAVEHLATPTEHGASVAELVYVEAPRYANLERIANVARELKRRHGKVPLVVIDYLQLVPHALEEESFRPLRESISRVVYDLRKLSLRDDTDSEWPGCPVLVLSTTARANVASNDTKSKGMDGTDPDALRHEVLEALKALPKEAGEIEATSVTAWVIGLGDKVQGAGGPTETHRHLTLRIAKNRLGHPGAWVPFRFFGATGRLEEDPARYTAARQADIKAAEAAEAARVEKMAKARAKKTSKS